MDNFSYAIQKENQLAALLRAKRCITSYSPGSKGPGDLAAKCPSIPMLIQMKSTREYLHDAQAALAHGLRNFTVEAERKLTHQARATGNRPVLSVSSGNYVWLWELSRKGFGLIHHGQLPKRGLKRK